MYLSLLCLRQHPAADDHQKPSDRGDHPGARRDHLEEADRFERVEGQRVLFVELRTDPVGLLSTGDPRVADRPGGGADLLERVAHLEQQEDAHEGAGEPTRLLRPPAVDQVVDQ